MTINEICADFQQEIRTIRDRQAKDIANSFSEFVLGLGDTFETDFIRYQPSLNRSSLSKFCILSCHNFIFC